MPLVSTALILAILGAISTADERFEMEMAKTLRVIVDGDHIKAAITNTTD